MFLFRLFVRITDRINGFLGQSVAWCALLMALVVTTLVILRAFFSVGSIAAQELVTYLHGCLLMLAMAYTLKSGGHIRVDIIYRTATPQFQAWVNILGSALLLLPFAGFLIVVSWDGVMTSWQIRESSSDSGGIPAVFLLKTLIPLAGGLLFLQGLAEIFRNLLFICGDHSTSSKASDLSQQKAK